MQIIRGKTSPAPRRVIYGPPGVGKSTFACAEPGALALDYERGLEVIGVDRVLGAADWEASLALIREACSGPGDHRAVVIDTIDRLEDQAAQLICAEAKKKSLAAFGYQEGFEALATRWRELLFILESAGTKGRSVTLVAHVQRSTIKDPTIGDHAKYVAAIHAKCWGPTARWADAVLFATYEAGMVDGRAIMTGARQLHTVAGTGYDAKHRPNIPSPLPLSWEAYSAAVAASNQSADEVRARIRELANTDDLRQKAEEFISKMGDDVQRLMVVETQLKKAVSL